MHILLKPSEKNYIYHSDFLSSWNPSEREQLTIIPRDPVSLDDDEGASRTILEELLISELDRLNNYYQLLLLICTKSSIVYSGFRKIKTKTLCTFRIYWTLIQSSEQSDSNEYTEYFLINIQNIEHAHQFV